MTKTIVIGIARMGSTRLPGKVLMDLGGLPVLEWVRRAASRARLVDDFIIATTTDPRDDAIVEWCKKYLVDYYRGSEDDILKRFTKAAKSMNADVAVRVTCDCPFIDPTIIDQIIALREATDAHYASNIDPPTWPDGLDCEAIRMDALLDAEEQAISAIDRECVTTWIQRNKFFYNCEALICPLPDMYKERWVLDTEDDYKLCQAIAEEIDDTSWLSIKKFLDENPELRKINAHHPRNERYFAALASEQLKPRSYETSKKWLAKTERIIPLGAQTFSKSKIQYPAESPLFITHADGGYCFDVDGNRYVDCVGGLLPVILGHRDPDVDYAVRRQIANGTCFSLSTSLETELAEILSRLIPCAEMVRYGKNGSDVTSAAVRLARACTGREYILSAGYHGWHDWAVEHDSLRNNGVPPGYVWTLKHGDNIWSYDGDNPAAVIVEPETNPEFLQECRVFCDETGALLIFDEVITGFRFDLGGAQKLYGITPDLACFGKAMGNGYPISALVGKRKFMETMERISFSGTFFGDAIGLAAAIATIEKLEREDAIMKITHRQADLISRIADIEPSKSGISFAGYIDYPPKWCLPRLQFINNDVKTLFIQEMAQQGVLIIASHNLSYAHQDNEIKRVVTAYENVLPMLADAIKTNKIRDLIKGRSIPSYANVRAAK